LSRGSGARVRGVHTSKQISPLEDAMFADSMLETSWAQHKSRGWTTLTSFGLQAFALGVLLMIPLFQNVVLPSAHTFHPVESFGAPPPRVVHVERNNVTVSNPSNFIDHTLIEPRQIPAHVAQVVETVAPPQVNYDNGVEGGTRTGAGSRDGVLNFFGSAIDHVIPKPVTAPSKPAFRTSSMLQGSLIRRVDPVYPQPARNARIQGPVVLEAFISKDGTMDRLRVISGHPMLVQAAIQAVSQWRYRPYVLNGQAIEVETQITVNFVLAN
jgi:protein TonB